MLPVLSGCVGRLHCNSRVDVRQTIIPLVVGNVGFGLGGRVSKRIHGTWRLSENSDQREGEAG